MVDETVFDPHNIQRKYKRELERVAELPHGNAKAITDFVGAYTYRKRQLSIYRKNTLAYSLRYFAELMDSPLKKISVKDIKRAVKKMAEIERKRTKPYSLHFWNGILKAVKVYLRNSMPSSKAEKIIKEHCKKEFQVENPYSVYKNLPSRKDFITKEKFLKLLAVADTQIKAILVVLWNGARASEVLNLERSDVTVDSDGAVHLTLRGKTGERTIKIQRSLSWYITEHKNKVNKGKGLFYKRGNKRFDYTALRHALQKVSVHAKYGKWFKYKNKEGKECKRYEGEPISALYFRRTHVSWCMDNLPDSSAKMRTHGNLGTRMYAVYGRTTLVKQDKDFDSATGDKPKIKENEQLQARTCFMCNESYGVDTEYCKKCNLPLDRKEIQEMIVGSAEKETKEFLILEKMKWLEEQVKELQNK